MRRNSRPAFSGLRDLQPLIASVSPGSQGKSSILKESCLGLNVRDFSHVTQERFVNVLRDVWQAHFSSTLTGTLRPSTNYFFLGH
jgi:hypothetical protein